MSFDRWVWMGVCLLYTAVDSPAQERKRPDRPGGGKLDAASMLKQFDGNGDGVLSADEGPAPLKSRFVQLDTNKDGKLDRTELEKFAAAYASRGGQPAGGESRPGERNAPPARSERHQDSLRIGAVAPDFTLADPTGDNEVTLSGFRNKKPVVLIFGSYT